ncbi:type II toxin-antitoxin system VapC family toxin (plasmid) [Phyllobacterium sp. 628]|uniref:type II toxin-antitoxin system VapC family toxin n=1 Tax=Phyllobacterium sp. 628 TaxID=2718938 RepID=UPI0016627DF2|nr:type II toxin-antitoxin system VapC family toxin [Phyllobacterium sp. 628]QND54982.1 type II toxin-antitoxin system VapC family toxin [Phyllobacterium sp. 628]
METLIIDASIAIKWVVEEDGTDQALKLRGRYRFAAPELLVAECANILWKKVQRNELVADEANLGARLLQRADIELIGMRGLMEQATMLAILLGHPAYDCIYIALAQHQKCRFVTADERLLRVINHKATKELAARCVSLDEID